eukprot:5864309-Amphidinium_carterae.1
MVLADPCGPAVLASKRESSRVENSATLPKCLAASVRMSCTCSCQMTLFLLMLLQASKVAVGTVHIRTPASKPSKLHLTEIEMMRSTGQLVFFVPRAKVQIDSHFVGCLKTFGGLEADQTAHSGPSAHLVHCFEGTHQGLVVYLDDGAMCLTTYALQVLSHA